MSYRVGFISGKQERFHIQKSINIIYHINKLKVKNHLIFLLGIEKAFDNILTKIQHLFVIKKISHQNRNRKHLSQSDKGHLQKKTKQNPTTNITLNGEKLHAFPLRSGMR